MNRDLAHPFGSEGYAREELRAEIASLILGSEVGLGYDPGQHAGYVDSWVKILRETPQEILYAAAAAEKISEYILGLEQKREISQTREATAVKEEIHMRIGLTWPCRTRSGTRPRQSAQTLFYIGHLDGVPNGYAENNRTKEVRRWKARGHHLGEEQRNELLAEAEKKRFERRQAEDVRFEATAIRLSNRTPVSSFWRRKDGLS